MGSHLVSWDLINTITAVHCHNHQHQNQHHSYHENQQHHNANNINENYDVADSYDMNDADSASLYISCKDDDRDEKGDNT